MYRYLPYIIMLRVLLIGFRMAVPKQHALQFGDVGLQKYESSNGGGRRGDREGHTGFFRSRLSTVFYPRVTVVR